MASDLVALLLQITEGFGIGLIETLIGTDMFHAERLGYGWQAFKLDDVAADAHFIDLFAILDVDVCRFEFLVVLDGETVARWRALAAQALHLGSNFIDTQRP